MARSIVPGMPQATSAWSGPRIIPGVASLALHRLLREPFQPGRVIAVLPSVIYLDFGQHAGEPRVIALTGADALCLPNAIALKVPHQDAATGTDGTAGETSTTQAKATEEAATEEAWAGQGRVLACGMDVQVRRWWDPCPVFGPLSRVPPGARHDRAGPGVFGRRRPARAGRTRRAGCPGRGLRGR